MQGYALTETTCGGSMQMVSDIASGVVGHCQSHTLPVSHTASLTHCQRVSEYVNRHHKSASANASVIASAIVNASVIVGVRVNVSINYSNHRIALPSIPNLRSLSIDQVGPPLSSVEMQLETCAEICDRHGNPYLTSDTSHWDGSVCTGRGEVLIRGPSVSMGYYAAGDDEEEVRGLIQKTEDEFSSVAPNEGVHYQSAVAFALVDKRCVKNNISGNVGMAVGLTIL